MPYKPIDLIAARVLADAGAITDVQVIATDDGLCITFNRSFIVSNRFQKPRYFQKADTAFGWLKGIGITKINGVDLTGWVEFTAFDDGSSGEPPKGKNTNITTKRSKK
jgi:hypothetical protein